MRPEGVYVRQGYSSVPASNTAIRQMIKQTDGDRFEEIRSLEQNLIFASAKRIFAKKNVKFGPNQMKTLGMITSDDVYTNLGLLLSDQCMHTIKVAIFQGTNQSEFKDRKEFAGSLFDQMENVYDLINLHNQLHATFDQLDRIDQRDYPPVAIREALFNLLIHREYSFSASSFISIYANRIEFTSIGGLVSGITLRDIKFGISVCRTPKLAHVFYRLKYIEAFGTGITKIMQAYENSDMTPQIKVSDNAFKIALPNLNTQPKYTKLDPLEEKVMILTKEHGFVTRKEVEAKFGISQSTSGRVLKSLTRNGLLVQEGNGKNTHYLISE